MRLVAMAALSLLLILPTASGVDAGRAPTAEELVGIEQVLRQHGFTRWEEIELEDNGTIWEVDDAIGQDGREFDIKLHVDTLEIIEIKPD